MAGGCIVRCGGRGRARAARRPVSSSPQGPVTGVEHPAPLADEVAPYLRAYRYEVVDEPRARHHARGGLAPSGSTGSTGSSSTRRAPTCGCSTAWTSRCRHAHGRRRGTGVRPALRDRGTFGELHRSLVERGFWLADLELTRAVRLRLQTFDPRSAPGQARPGLKFDARGHSPTAAGATLPAHAGVARQGGGERADYLRLWACAFYSGNHPYALDVAVECRDEAPSSVPALVGPLRAAQPGRRPAGSVAPRREGHVRNLRRFVSKSY